MEYLMSNAKPDFDTCLKFGKKYEDMKLKIYQECDKLEVKTEDGIWKKTGNMAIEYECNGVPSGIMTTKADWWEHWFTKDGEPFFSITFPVKRLKRMFKDTFDIYPKVRAGDHNDAKVLLIPLEGIMWYFKEYTEKDDGTD